MQTFFEMYIAIGIIVSVVMLFGSYLKEIEEMERKSEKVDKPMLGALQTYVRSNGCLNSFLLAIFSFLL